MSRDLAYLLDILGRRGEHGTQHEIPELVALIEPLVLPDEDLDT